MQSQINSSSVVGINSTEFAAKFNSKKEVSIEIPANHICVSFPGLPVPNSGGPRLLPTVRYGDHLPLS